MAEHSISFTRSFEQHPCTIPKNKSMVVGNNLLISLKTDLFCLDATPTHRSAVVSAALFSFPVGRTDLSWGFFEKPGHQVEVQQGTVTVQTCSLHCVCDPSTRDPSDYLGWIFDPSDFHRGSNVHAWIDERGHPKQKRFLVHKKKKTLMEILFGGSPRSM